MVDPAVDVETIAAAYCSSSRKDLMTIFLEQLKYSVMVIF